MLNGITPGAGVWSGVRSEQAGFAQFVRVLVGLPRSGLGTMRYEAPAAVVDDDRLTVGRFAESDDLLVGLGDQAVRFKLVELVADTFGCLQRRLVCQSPKR